MLKRANGQNEISRLPGSLLILFFSCLISSTHAFTRPDTLHHIPTIDFRVDLIDGITGEERNIRAGLLYDLTRDRIVWQKDMDYAYPIASLTKMMVALLASEDLNRGTVCLDDQISVKRSYKKRLKRRRYTTYTVEERYSFEDVLKMAMVASHNESTIWIARHCSGSLEAFVERMNRRAQELGMTKTQYSNPSGLPAIISELDNSSSPRDQLILALELLKHPKVMEIAAIPYANVYNGKGYVNYRNHNGLVINYGQEVDGMKTGFTRAAGFCLVATAQRAGHRLISIVYGCKSPYVRNGIVANMMNSYFDAIKLGRLGESAPDLNQYCYFLDSVNQGLAVIRPRNDIIPQTANEDEAYGYTYKTITEKVRKTYTVRPGDNLGKIASRQGVSIADLRRWNRLRGSTIQAGQKLAVYSTVKKRIPVKLVVDENESIADLQPSSDTSSQSEVEISSEYRHPEQTDSLQQNEEPFTLQEPSTVPHHKDTKAISTVKAVAVKKNANAGQSPRVIYHTVQPGDTLWNIAQRYQSNIEQIKRLNRISNSRNLKSGTRIKVPVKGS